MLEMSIPVHKARRLGERELDLRVEAEIRLLAALITSPDFYAWHLAALDPSAFACVRLRQIAGVVCDLRDRGARIHWRRVRWQSRKRFGLEAGDCANYLIRTAGGWDLDYCVAVIRRQEAT